ncbi:AraC family transcriptional regulator [Paenibacillus anaericanus]|uniref:AraC family transcriptional regulator n=1 Tax=Paenibacillus anaericanus TaxID=170367 RepID=A0A433Y748_9BACL|nr:AraC family transcriptional regulator [Paenibacillus anaericanus]RUT45189.1 AraC family transcriptional regulator [Paenibacillus anaericanus]
MSRINITFTSETLLGQLDLNLLFFGKEECLPSHTWGPGLRDSYILHYIHSGCGIFGRGEQSHFLTAGQGFLIPPSTIVHYQANENDPWTYSWVGFNGLHAKSFMQRANLSPPYLVYDTGKDSRPHFESFYDDLLNARSLRNGDVLSQSILYRLMAELISSSKAPLPDTKPSPSKESYLNQAIGFIENNYSQKISILDIAASVGLDRTYLSSLFKIKFGVSLQTFLLEYRINRATELLRNPELSVSDISRSVGYADPFLFSKMFKKVTGSSPRNSRDKNTEDYL